MEALLDHGIAEQFVGSSAHKITAWQQHVAERHPERHRLPTFQWTDRVNHVRTVVRAYYDSVLRPDAETDGWPIDRITRHENGFDKADVPMYSVRFLFES